MNVAVVFGEISRFIARAFRDLFTRSAIAMLSAPVFPILFSVLCELRGKLGFEIKSGTTDIQFCYNTVFI